MTIDVNTVFTLTADGNSDPAVLYTRRPLQVEAVYDSGTGTAKLQSRAASGEWVDVDQVVFTSSGRANVLIYHEFGEEYRGVLSGSSGSPSIRLIVTEAQGAN